MLHPQILEQIANEHHNDLLKEAEAYRRARQVKKERCVQVSLMKRMAAWLDRLLLGSVRKLVDQGTAITNESFIR